MGISVDNERAGERVFGDVDAALAERIVSRAMGNSGGAAADCVYGADAADTEKREKRKRRRGLIVQAAIPALLALIALWLLVRQGKRQ